MKQYYTDYANHLLRYYFSGKEVVSDLDKLAHDACARAVSKLSKSTLAIIREVYTDKSHQYKAEIVEAVAKAHNLPAKRVWTMLAFVEKNVAVERGLI